MPVSVGDVFSFSLQQRLFGQVCYNTWALKINELGSTVDELEWLNGMFVDGTGYMNIAGGLRDEIRNLQSDEVTHTNWIVSRVSPTLTPLYTFPIITNPDGVIDGTCETANIALSIERKGALPGRRQRGRIALLGVPATGYAAGQFLTGTLTQAGDIALEMVGLKDAGAELGQFNMGFWSPAHDGVVDGAPVHYDAQFVVCYSAQAKPTVRVQRSRTIGVGR